MAPDHPHFDDPVLKAALKRAVGAESAPPSLRQRVERSLAAEAARPTTSPAQQAQQARWRRHPLVGVAAAAVLILGVSLIFNHFWSGEQTGDYRLPALLASNMVSTHDDALGQAELHQLDVPRDDLNKIRDTLKDKLGHPVLVASLGPEWKLEGARVAKIGETDAAQLVYTKGADKVSVFSVSGRRYYATQGGTEYAQTEDGHPIAGFVKDGVVHCVVGSKGTKLREKDLARLRDSVKKQISRSDFGLANHTLALVPVTRP